MTDNPAAPNLPEGTSPPAPLPPTDTAIDQGEDVSADELAGDRVEPGYTDPTPEDAGDEAIDLVVDDATTTPSGEVE